MRPIQLAGIRGVACYFMPYEFSDIIARLGLLCVFTMISLSGFFESDECQGEKWNGWRSRCAVSKVHQRWVHTYKVCGKAWFCFSICCAWIRQPELCWRLGIAGKQWTKPGELNIIFLHGPIDALLLPGPHVAMCDLAECLVLQCLLSGLSFKIKFTLLSDLAISLLETLKGLNKSA